LLIFLFGQAYTYTAPLAQEEGSYCELIKRQTKIGANEIGLPAELASDILRLFALAKFIFGLSGAKVISVNKVKILSSSLLTFYWPLASAK